MNIDRFTVEEAIRRIARLPQGGPDEVNVAGMTQEIEGMHGWFDESTKKCMIDLLRSHPQTRPSGVASLFYSLMLPNIPQAERLAV